MSAIYLKINFYFVQGLSQENIQILPQNIEELQRRVVKAETSLKERDHENTALREQVREFEKRWSEYESKMKVVEEMWQSQMASLQVSFIIHLYTSFRPFTRA